MAFHEMEELQVTSYKLHGGDFTSMAFHKMEELHVTSYRLQVAWESPRVGAHL